MPVGGPNLVVHFGGDVRALLRALYRARAGVSTFSSFISRVAANLGILTGGFAAARLVTQAEQFARSMKESLAIMPEVGEDVKQVMEKSAFRIASISRYSASEVAKAYYYLTSAGLDVKQSIQALPQVTAFAQAGMFDLSRAVSLAADAQSALGLKSRDPEKNLTNLTRVTDVLTKANTLANATVEQFSEALTNKTAAAMNLVNMQIEEGVAVLSVWADKGLKGAEAGTAFGMVMRDLQRAAIENAEVFERYGIRVWEAGQFRHIADILEDIEHAFAELTPEARRSALMLMGFTDRSVAYTQSLIGTSRQIKEFEAQLKLAFGTTVIVASKQLTPLQMALSEVGSTAVKAASQLVSALTPILFVFARLASSVLQLVPQLAALGIVLGTVYAAFVITDYPIRLLILGVAGLTTGIIRLNRALIILAGTLMAVAFLFKGSISALAGLAAVVLLGIGAWYGYKRAVSETKDSLKEMAVTTVELREALEKLKSLPTPWESMTEAQKKVATEALVARAIGALKVEPEAGGGLDHAKLVREAAERAKLAADLVDSLVKAKEITEAQGVELKTKIIPEMVSLNNLLKRRQVPLPLSSEEQARLAAYNQLLERLGGKHEEVQRITEQFRQQAKSVDQVLKEYRELLDLMVRAGKISEEERARLYTKKRAELFQLSTFEDVQPAVRGIIDEIFQLQRGLSDSEMEARKLAGALGAPPGFKEWIARIIAIRDHMRDVRKANESIDSVMKDLESRLFRAKTGASGFADHFRVMLKMPGMDFARLKEVIALYEKVGMAEAQREEEKPHEIRLAGAFEWGSQQAWSQIMAGIQARNKPVDRIQRGVERIQNDIAIMRGLLQEAEKNVEVNLPPG